MFQFLAFIGFLIRYEILNRIGIFLLLGGIILMFVGLSGWAVVALVMSIIFSVLSLAILMSY